MRKTTRDGALGEMKEERSALILRALDSYKERGQKRTETVEYRGVQRVIEVVTLSPDVPLFNPNNSRLRAQLKVHPKSSIVAADPTSPEAQEVLSQLLANTDKFDALKKQLFDYKQQEPGIITRDGLLVNGNTRLAAVRQLGLTGFDVAVLPADATDDDFVEIEMVLQLRKNVHQDYTFTNELLLVESFQARTQNEETTIANMQWKRGGHKKLRSYQGYLQLIEEIRALNPKLTYDFFDDKKELIVNLHQQYVTTLEQSPKDAETMKLTRIVALFLGLNKDEIREIDEYFLEEEVLQEMQGSELEELISPFQTHHTESDVLDDLLDESPGSSVDLRRLAVEISEKVIDDTGLVNDALIDQNFKKLHNKVRTSARRIREDRITSDMRAEPIDYLEDVTKRIQELADRIPTLFQDEQFDAAKFQFKAKKTEKAIAALQDALDRTSGGKV